MKQGLCPPFLVPGAQVAIVATSFRPDYALVIGLMKFYEDAGYDPHPMGDFEGFGAFADTDEVRLLYLQAAIDNPNIKAIHFVRGGYGITRIIDRVCFDSYLNGNLKWMIGYSDVTAVLMQAANLGLASIHGPMAAQIMGDPAEGVSLLKFLAGLTNHLSWTTSPHKVQGRLEYEGVLLGGNLTTLAHLAGTNTTPLQAPNILVLEDVGECHYAIDRHFVQLARSGIVHQDTKAILLGSFTEMRDSEAGFGYSVLQMAQNHFTTQMGIPVLNGLPIGHGSHNAPLPIGSQVTLQLEGIDATLQFAFNSGAHYI